MWPGPASSAAGEHSRSLQWPEEGPQVGCQFGGGLHRGEVPAAAELAPVRIGRGGDQFPHGGIGAEDRKALRHVRRRAPVGGVRLLVQGVGGGGTGAGEPVQADCREQLVTVDRQVSPLVYLLGDPGELQQR